MTVTTVAAPCTGPDAPFELREVEVDSPRADEILVRLVATGVCHTDIFLKQGLKPGGEPAVLGHEGAGVVEAVGAQVSGLKPGDHVVLTMNSCGQCVYCRAGATPYCIRTAAENALSHRPDGTPTNSYFSASA
jgi:aryl-alcohol dehydrogenase